MKVFNVAVDGFKPKNALEHTCVEQQQRMFDYTLVTDDDPIVKECREKYAQAYEDAVSQNRVRSFANIVRLKWIQKHQGYVYMDMDIYPLPFFRIPDDTSFASWYNSFAILYDNSHTATKLLKACSKTEAMWDKEIMAKAGVEANPVFKYMAEHFCVPKPVDGVLRRSDYFTDDESELRDILTLEDGLKHKVYTTRMDLRQYSCKKCAVRWIPEEIADLVKEFVDESKGL